MSLFQKLKDFNEKNLAEEEEERLRREEAETAESLRLAEQAILEAKLRSETEKVIISTTNEIPGAKILQYKGFITYSDYCELTDHLYSDVGFATQVLENQLIEKIQQQVLALGANGVIGLKINQAIGLDSYSTGGGAGGFSSYTVHSVRGVMVSVYGTAVFFEFFKE